LGYTGIGLRVRSNKKKGGGKWAEVQTGPRGKKTKPE